MFKKTIISEFFTTVSFSQMMQSLYLMTFWSYKLKYWKDKELFEKELLEKIDHPSRPLLEGGIKRKIISFYNWRSAIYHALKMIWVGKDDEVIVNWYNCVSVSNAVIPSGVKIVYSDIEAETLSLDFEVLKKNISSKTKVIILQHTFWKLPRDYEKIIDFVRKNNIVIIEDMAHSLGNNTEILGDFAVFSTGRDKVISSVTGGFLVINNEKFFDKIEKVKNSLQMPSTKLIFQNLMYNFVWYMAYKTYDFFKLWRIIIFLSRKLKLITEILSVSEKSCNFAKFNLDFPNALAYLAFKELEKLDKYTKKRLENAKFYLENIKNKKIEIIFKDLKNYNSFRFPILLESEGEKNKLIKLWRKNKIIFWTSWSGINLAPIWTDLEKSHYKIWSCPVAEDISKRILTLPNHKLISKKDLERVVEVLNSF